MASMSTKSCFVSCLVLFVELVDAMTICSAPQRRAQLREKEVLQTESLPTIEIDNLIKQLGSDNSKTRELASKALLKFGEEALPRLEAATKTENLELRRRAEMIHAEIFAKISSPKLPDGVIHVKLPPGELRMEHVRDGRSLLRITVGKTVIEAKTIFLGNGAGASRYDAIKAEDAVKGGNVWIFVPGSSILVEDYVPLNKLMSGNLYVTTPSIVFRWGKDAKPPPIRNLHAK